MLYIAIAIVSVSALTIILYDIFKQDRSVPRAYLLCLICMGLAVMTASHGGWAPYVWLFTALIWLFNVWLRRFVARQEAYLKELKKGLKKRHNE